MVVGRPIFVAGAEGVIGAALLRVLARGGQDAVGHRFDGDPDRQPQRLAEAIERTRPALLLLVGGPSAGIQANLSWPADLLRQNLLLACAGFEAARRAGVEKLLYLGSSCMYPREAPQPMTPELLLAGVPEPSSLPYALGKLAGLGLARAYRQQHRMVCITAVPANVYGPDDDFAPETGHVIPALLQRAHLARETSAPTLGVWGTGEARRDFIYADDVAEACLLLAERYDDEAPVNIGSGDGVTIRAVAQTAAAVVGFAGQLVFERDRPEGAPVKVLDARPLQALGWRARTSLQDGIQQTYRAWLQGSQGQHGS